jgi:hypothetical protein
LARSKSADKGLVHLDVTAQKASIGIDHRVTDLVKKKPRAPVATESEIVLKIQGAVLSGQGPHKVRVSLSQRSA